MQPPSAQQPSVRKRIPLVAVVLILVGLICIGLIVLFAAVMIPTMRRMGQVAGCGASFTMMRQAVLDYARDKGGVLPTAKTWEDDVASFYQAQFDKALADLRGTPMDRYIPFARPGELFTCVDDRGRKTGISFNEALSGKKLEEIQDKRNTVLLFEVPTTERNQHSPYDMVRAPRPRLMNTYRDWLVVPVEGDHLGFADAREAAQGAQRLLDLGKQMMPPPK